MEPNCKARAKTDADASAEAEGEGDIENSLPPSPPLVPPVSHDCVGTAREEIDTDGPDKPKDKAGFVSPTESAGP